jgi:AICAR transformylase/IMP cyclohydrolase PurH
VGGPTMVRSAAKNYHDVTIITSSDQYEELIDELKKNKGSTSLDLEKNYLELHLLKQHIMTRLSLIILIKEII